MKLSEINQETMRTVLNNKFQDYTEDSREYYVDNFIKVHESLAEDDFGTWCPSESSYLRRMVSLITKKEHFFRYFETNLKMVTDKTDSIVRATDHTERDTQTISINSSGEGSNESQSTSKTGTESSPIGSTYDSDIVTPDVKTQSEDGTNGSNSYSSNTETTNTSTKSGTVGSQDVHTIVDPVADMMFVKTGFYITEVIQTIVSELVLEFGSVI